MTMPSAEAVNAELRAMGDVVPDVPDHHAEIGFTEQRGQIPMTPPPPRGPAAKHTGGSDAGLPVLSPPQPPAPGMTRAARPSVARAARGRDRPDDGISALAPAAARPGPALPGRGTGQL